MRGKEVETRKPLKKTCRNLKLLKIKNEYLKNKMMKNSMILFGLILTGIFALESYGQKKYQNNNNTTPINSKRNSSEITNEVDPNSSPESVMSTIFQAAQSGEVGILKFLLPPYDEQRGEIPYDGDCKALCNPGNESMREELGGNYITLEEFKEYFSKAKIIGTPSITGDEAKVNFVFGPNLEYNETMNMQRINGKWYLRSF